MEKSQSELNSLNLIKGHIQIVQASITQNFGKIVNNHNNLLAKFFGYSVQEFKSINHIKQLMPQYVAQVHDELINAFIIRGHSKFLEENHQVFCRNKQGFFFPITLQLTLVYGITDDLQMNAVLLKIDSNTSYITFNQTGEIVGFNINFFNHIFGLETSRQKWQEINCYTMFQGFGNLVVNSIKRSRKLTDNVLEEYIFELTLSDIQFGGLENQKKSSQISKKQRFEELNFLRMISQDVTAQGYQSTSTAPKNQKDLYVIKKTNSICSCEYSQDSQFDYQLEQNNQSTIKSNNKNIHDQNEKQKNDDFLKQFQKDQKIQYNQSKFSNQQNIENSIISSEQAQITDCQYQIDNSKYKVLTSQRIYNNENLNSFYQMKNQQSEQQLNEDDKQNEEDNQAILMKIQENLEQKFNNYQIQPSQKKKKVNSVQKHFLSQQNTQAISSKYNQETSKIESENENQDDFNQIQETNSNFEAFKENQIINNIIFQQLTLGSQISRFLLGKQIQIDFKFLIFIIKIGCSSLIFTSISTVILLYIFSKQDSFSKNLNVNETYSSFYEQISQFGLTQILAYEKYLNIQPKLQYDQIYSVNKTQCQNLIQLYMEDLKIIMLNIDVDKQIDTYIYTLGEGKSTKLSFVNFLYLNVNSMIEVNNYQATQKQGMNYRNNQYILQSNILENRQISSNAIQLITQNQNDLISQINKSFIISIFIILGLIIIILVLILPVIRKINKFQEVIFQVVSRITYEEVDSQINKFQSYQNKILNNDKQWISYNFLNAHKKNLDELRLSYQKTNSFASTQQEKKGKNQTNNQKLISSQLVQTHLKTFLYFLLFFLFCFSYVAFISIALGVSYKYQKEIQQRFELYQYNVQNLQKFQTMLLLSESALRIDLIQSIDDQFPIQNQTDVKNNFLSSIQDLNQFLIKINDYTQNTSFLDKTEQREFQYLLQTDLCSEYKLELQCSEQSPVQRIFQQGFLAVLIHYCKYLQQSFDDINTKSSDINQQIEYVLTSEYPYMTPQGFNIPNTNFKSIVSSSLNFLTNKIDEQKLFLFIYTFLGGSIMYFVWFGLSIKIKNIITLHLNSVKYLLTCIPLEKQQDENIMFMLKKIQNI